MNSNTKIKQFFKMTPAKVILFGFAALILIGAFLLCLPISNTEGKWIPFVDAAFTATTSVCVTGLMVFDIAAELNLFGQIVVLFLIQFGGLGFVTMTTLVFMIIGKKINYQARITLQESLNKDDNEGVVKTVKRVVLITLFCEFVGFLAILPPMINFTNSVGQGIFKSIFLSISAFCNAGIDSLGTLTPEFSNLMVFYSNPFILIPVMFLIVMGGIGFIVPLDIIETKTTNKKLTIHTKIVLVMTAILIVGGAVTILACEWNNMATIGGMSVGDKIMNSFFQSITTRTAGFCTFDQSQMTQISLIVSELLMFIGGSPMSIAGGIKTTTFFLLLLLVFRNQDQNGNIIFNNRKISNKVLTKAVRIAIIMASLLIVGSILIFVFEGSAVSLDAIIYEVLSAICTVGLSFGITPLLSVGSKIVLILLMYVGRIGMLTIPLAFKSKDTAAIEYVNAKIIVG